MWLLAYAIAALGIGAALLLVPGVIRERLLPDWAGRQGPLAGTSLIAFRFAGLCLVLIGVIAALGFFLGTR